MWRALPCATGIWNIRLFVLGLFNLRACPALRPPFSSTRDGTVIRFPSSESSVEYFSRGNGNYREHSYVTEFYNFISRGWVVSVDSFFVILLESSFGIGVIG